MKYISHKFENVSQYVEYLNKGVVNGVFKANEEMGLLSSQSTNDNKWRGTNSWEDAQNLLRYGDREKFALLKKSLDKLNMKGSGYKMRRKVTTSIVGCVPHIPNYLQGMPECMIDIVKTKIKSSKVLNIIYNASVSCDVSPQRIIEAGAKMLSKVQNLERQGYRANLYCTFSSKKGKETASILVRIKSSEQYLDALKCAYPLVNPSFLRRHYLRYLEVCEITERDFSNGYGVPQTDREAIQKAFPRMKWDYYYTVDSIMAEK